MPALEMLLAARGVEVAGVFTQPPRRAGRGRKLRESAVAEFLRAPPRLSLSLPPPPPPIFTPHTFDVAAQNALRELRPDVLVTVAYGLLLPSAALEIPRLGGVNLHASLLPRWRGAAPVERAIEAGDSHSGVSLMQMDSGLDTGAVLARARVAIAGDDTGGSLRAKLARAAADLLAENLDALFARTLPGEKQNENDATYANKLQKSEAEIDWNQSAAQIARRVRAFYPRPVAHSALQGARLRVLSAAEVCADKNLVTETYGQPGEILDISHDGIVVATGDGALLLREVQKPGGAPMSAANFVNGMRIKRGMRFCFHGDSNSNSDRDRDRDGDHK